MKPLQITSFLDGRPGHEKQTKGILLALADFTEILVKEVRIQTPSLATVLKNWVAYTGSFFSPQASAGPQPVTDFLIGTGTHTHIPMIIHKKKYGTRVVTCMTPDRFLAGRIDLCFIPRHDEPRTADNIFVTVGPPNTARNRRVHSNRKGLILVGGIDTKSHFWDSQLTLKQIADIIDRAGKMDWTISSSPRTPDDMIRLLVSFADKTSNTVFLDSKETSPGWIENAYAENMTVWVTADSVSMVYESLTAGCQVGILPVRWKNRTNKFQKSVDFLRENGRVISYEEWSAGKKMNSGAPLEEASRCAKEILRRWWPDRLQ